MFTKVNDLAYRMHSQFINGLVELDGCPRVFVSGRRKVFLDQPGKQAKELTLQPLASSTIATSVVWEELVLPDTDPQIVGRLLFAPTDPAILDCYICCVYVILCHAFTEGLVSLGPEKIAQVLTLIHPNDDNTNKLNPYDQIPRIVDKYHLVRDIADEQTLQEVFTFLERYVLKVQDEIIGAWKRKRDKDNWGHNNCTGPDLIVNLMRKTMSRIMNATQINGINDSYNRAIDGGNQGPGLTGNVKADLEKWMTDHGMLTS